MTIWPKILSLKSMRKIYRKIYRLMNYIYKSLLQFCLWCEIPLKLLKVYKINVQDCLRIHTFIISDPLTRFKKWKFPNFGGDKSVRPFQQDFHQYFRFFPLNIQVLKFWQYWKLEKSDFTKKMERKLNLFTLSHRKVLDVEI